MTRHTAPALLVLAFVVVATANSGGYRYGVSDQAFYVPAIAMRVDPGLFPRDRLLLEPQMRLWAGDELIGGVGRATGLPLPDLFAGLYLLTTVLLALGAVALARALGCDWWTISITLVLLAFRHRISKTGANSLEGYFHPRMLAFACGLFALAAVARARHLRASAWTVLTALVHTTTALWFGAVLVLAALWQWRASRHAWQIAAASAASGLMLGGWVLAGRLAPIDDLWLAVLDGKDYLFPADWPLYAWLTNLAYPVVIVAIHRMRLGRGIAAPGETALVAGLVGLAGLFLLSVPFTELRLALAVQLQVNRVFWVLDAATAVMVGWWLTDRIGARGPRARLALAGVLLVMAAGRGWYVVTVEANRPLARLDLPADTWTDVMGWLGNQPTDWYVLADPDHGWKYGSSVRVAARRDTLVEAGKDTAMAMYDRDAALRVADRLAATADFDRLTEARLRDLDARFELDVLVDRADRTFPWPVLYRNADFVVYDLR